MVAQGTPEVETWSSPAGGPVVAVTPVALR